MATKTKIYKDRYYIIANAPGISGFQRFDEREYRVVSGLKAANHREYVIGEWSQRSGYRYALENGRMPEHQPVVDADGVVVFLRANPYQCARVIK